MKDIEDEIPFEVPEGWAWCRLPELCTTPIIDGTHQTPTYSDKENGIPFLSSKDVTSGKIDWSKIKYITKSLHEELYKRVAPQINDILLAKNGTTGIAAIVEDDIIFDIYVTLAVIRPNINLCNPHFLLNLVNSDFCKSQFNSHLTGIGVPNLHLVDIKKTLIPLPPLEEQKEINDTLKVYLDKIEILNINKGELQTAIKHAKSKILDLAIHGKLVPQDLSEEPASKLLEKIRAEKQAKIAAGELKRDKNDSYIYKNPSDNCHYRKYANGQEENVESEIPFDLPKDWIWCQLGTIAYEMADGPFGSDLKKEHYTDKKEARIIQLSNIGEGFWREENTKYTTFEHAKEISRSIVKPGTLVIAKMMPAGRTIICPNKEAMYVLSSDSIRCSHSELVNKEYLLKVINSDLFRKKIADDTQGTTRARTNIAKLKAGIFPLPPAEEQKRIVSKIEEIFGILDTISKNLE